MSITKIYLTKSIFYIIITHFNTTCSYTSTQYPRGSYNIQITYERDRYYENKTNLTFNLKNGKIILIKFTHLTFLAYIQKITA